MDEHQGDIELDNIKQLDVAAHVWRKKIALLTAESSWWYDTVGEHFENIPTKDCQALGFSEDISNWSISRLSSGEKQRLGLLRLFQNTPEVILLDEPTANLDQHNSSLFENFVMDYLQKNSAGAIWVSHDTQQLKRICSYKFELKNGLLSQC